MKTIIATAAAIAISVFATPQAKADYVQHGNHYHYSHGHHHHHRAQAAYWVPAHNTWNGYAWVTVGGYYHTGYVPAMPAPIYEARPHRHHHSWAWVNGYWYWTGANWGWQSGQWVRR